MRGIPKDQYNPNRFPNGLMHDNDHNVRPWEQTMTADEVEFCNGEIAAMIERMDEHCCDNFRAARLWKPSQVRRFFKQSADGCCGSAEWVERRWNPAKGRHDLYLLGFNYGH